MNLRKRLIPGSLPSPSEIKLEIPLTYSEGNGSIEAQDFTESDSKTQSPPKTRLRFETLATFNSPSKCASSSSSDTKNLRLIQEVCLLKLIGNASDLLRREWKY
ncbi:uncharacterized protein LOC123680700 [Harmonia axyridis]|uniref:uncharacterized protein LOC123680700 n=1 Tax=Harmonia axyridis TaxID=115357 RepID=UPI001E277360|nr:uncharacterized protein LOC123680700 [Harmonia axyridis]XP_045474690.1 uncharacterized protein LOC123680700 [Harmonia axyridis]